jgi:hypothetical protein
LGTIVTTINPAYTASEVARQLTMSKTEIILAQPNSIPIVEEAISKSNGELTYLYVCHQ